MIWSASLSSMVSNSILPWVDWTMALKSLTRGTTTDVVGAQRSAKRVGNHRLKVGNRETHRDTRSLSS